MKKNRLAASVLAIAVSITASGCGNQIYELTEEEEAVIVQYSAHAVTKYNKKQTEGVEDITKLKAQMEEEKQQEEEKKAEAEEERRQQEEEKQPDTQADPADEKADETQSGQQVNYVSLKEALKLNGIDVSYQKYEVVSAYQATDSFMVSADSGNELLVLHFNLRNSGTDTAKCNILSKMPVFTLTVNGTERVSADTTILLNDLGTYQKNMKAGDTQEAVLVFQVKKGAVKTVNSMDLEVMINETSAQVQLTAG